jgi:multiple antibiotic resistance protein
MTLHRFFYAFIPIFVATDVPGIIPIFLSLTQGLSDTEKRRVSGQALLTAFAISVIFVAVGRWIFKLLGITVADFQMAGGIVLLVLAVMMMLHFGRKADVPNIDVGPVPLGTPLIVGPAVLTSLIILIPLYGYELTLAAFCVNLLIVAVAFQQSQRLVKWVSTNGLRAASQVISLFLAAIAVSMIRRGVESLH